MQCIFNWWHHSYFVRCGSFKYFSVRLLLRCASHCHPMFFLTWVRPVTYAKFGAIATILKGIFESVYFRTSNNISPRAHGCHVHWVQDTRNNVEGSLTASTYCIHVSSSQGINHEHHSVSSVSSSQVSVSWFDKLVKLFSHPSHQSPVWLLPRVERQDAQLHRLHCGISLWNTPMQHDS
jgi:hypothetical protein